MKKDRAMVTEIKRIMKEIENLADEINDEDIDDFEEGNKAYLLLQDAKDWLESLLIKLR